MRLSRAPLPRGRQHMPWSVCLLLLRFVGWPPGHSSRATCVSLRGDRWADASPRWGFRYPQVRLEVMRSPDTRNRARMYAHFLRHQATAPVRRILRLLMECLADDLCFVRSSDASRSTRARSIPQQGLDSIRFVAVQPLRNGRSRHTHLGADCRARDPLCRGQNDRCSLDHALRRSPSANQLLQALAISSA